MSKRKKRRTAFRVVIIIFFLTLGGLAFGMYYSGIAEEPQTGIDPGSIKEASPPSEPEFVDITIASVGDILIHNTVYYAAYDPFSKSYDFRDQLKYVKPYLEDADITIANLETVLAGPERGYASYPKFNTPDEIVDALKDSGVDILTAANNHRMDQGVPGYYRTIEQVRDKGLDIIGVKTEEMEKTYVIKDISGVKIAFLNFGYAYPLWDGSLDINGLILPANMSGLVDTFDPQDLDKSILALEKKVAAAKEDGAEIIVVCMHWGDEYHRLPSDFQKKLASAIISFGADVIFGGHPHVLQPAVILSSPDGSRVPVFYSQGNFISDQRKETVDDIYTEQGIIAKVTFRIEKPKKLQPVHAETPEVIAAEAIPTWVNKKIINNRFFYEVIPAQDALTSLGKFPRLNSADLERIRFCADTVKQISVGLKQQFENN